MQDDYEGDFSSERVSFTHLDLLLKHICLVLLSFLTKDIIKKATISYLTGTDTSNTHENSLLL